MHTPDHSPLTSLSRRNFIVLGLGAFAVAALPLSLRRRRQIVRRSLPVMGTIAEIAVVHTDLRRAQLAIDAAFGELTFVERTMSRFSPTSDVGRANREAAKTSVAITSATATVVQEALLWARASNGAFDPCIGTAVALWDVQNRQEPPAGTRVSRYAGRKLYKALSVEGDSTGGAVRFGDPEVAIDLGGIAKGYAVDRAVAALREHGITQAFVNVGGDLYALGTSEDGDPWKVGVRSPQDPTRIAETIEIADQAVATSGDYLRFFEHGGRRYHHLLDPSTGSPRATSVHSLTVTADRCMTADAAATTAFGVPQAHSLRVLRTAASDARIVSRI